MKSLISVLICSLLLSTFMLAQSQENEDQRNQIRFFVDYTGFKNIKNTNETYQEIYIALSNSQLSYFKKGAKYLAGINILILVKDLEDNQVARSEWESISEIDSLQQAERQVAFEIAGFLLPPGKYNMEIDVTDLNSKTSGTYNQPMSVIDLSENKLQLSEIEFSQSIKRTENINKFVKNNLEILPHPARVYGSGSPFMYFYSEIYNLNPDSDGYSKEYSIIDDQNNVVKFSEKDYVASSINSIWVEKINLLPYVSSKYLLRLKIIDKKTGNTELRESEFWLNNPNKLVSFAQMDDTDIEEFRAQIYYLVDKNELKLYDQLNRKAKVEYINNFWKNRSPEFKKEHLQRFYIAQQRFSSKGTPAWKSDQGRIYITYGPPDEIEREPASINSKAYEIWIYESLKKQAQVIFVFGDLAIFGNYQLLHSNIKSPDRMEIYNPKWREELMIAR